MLVGQHRRAVPSQRRRRRYFNERQRLALLRRPRMLLPRRLLSSGLSASAVLVRTSSTNSPPVTMPPSTEPKFTLRSQPAYEPSKDPGGARPAHHIDATKTKFRCVFQLSFAVPASSWAETVVRFGFRLSAGTHGPVSEKQEAWRWPRYALQLSRRSWVLSDVLPL